MRIQTIPDCATDPLEFGFAQVTERICSLSDSTYISGIIHQVLQIVLMLSVYVAAHGSLVNSSS